MRLHAAHAGRLAEIQASEWDALDAGGNPFLSHGFLEALSGLLEGVAP